MNVEHFCLMPGFGKLTFSEHCNRGTKLNVQALTQQVQYLTNARAHTTHYKPPNPEHTRLAGDEKSASAIGISGVDIHAALDPQGG